MVRNFDAWRENYSQKPGYRWIALIPVTIGAFMMNLDSSIVTVALPVWADLFHVSPAVLQWILVAYLLVITSIIPTMGVLADKFGRKRFFIMGVSIFILGSALCAMGNSIEELIAFRMVQAIGASMVMSNVIAITSMIFPPGERGKALGINGSFVAAGTILGPAAGSFILSAWNWRGIFWVNIPLGLISLLLVGILLKPLKSEQTNRSFDVAGSILFFVSSSAIVLYLSNGPLWGWQSGWSWLMLGVGVVFFILFVVQEFRADDPLINPAYFRVPSFSIGLFCTYLHFLLILLSGFVLPLYLHEVGVPIAHMGWLLAAQPLVMLIASPLAGWMADKFNVDGTAALGMAVQAMGMFLLSGLGGHPSYAQVVLALAVYGFGLGLFSSPNNVSVLESLPQNRAGIAGALISTARNMGRVSGVSIATILLYVGMSLAGNSSGHRIIDASSFVFLAAMSLALLGMGLTVGRFWINRLQPLEKRVYKEG